MIKWSRCKLGLNWFGVDHMETVLLWQIGFQEEFFLQPSPLPWTEQTLSGGHRLWIPAWGRAIIPTQRGSCSYKPHRKLSEGQFSGSAFPPAPLSQIISWIQNQSKTKWGQSNWEALQPTQTKNCTHGSPDISRSAWNGPTFRIFQLQTVAFQGDFGVVPCTHYGMKKNSRF